MALVPAGARATLTPLSAAVLGYAAWLVGANLWLHPYTAAASYDAAFLFGGWLIGIRAGRERAALLFRVTLAFAVALGAWSLAQIAVEGGRGHAVFETPSTLAAVLNIPLAAGAVLLAAGVRGARLMGCVVLVAAALLGTQSRGGLIALVAAGTLAFVLLRRGTVALLAAVALALVLALTWGTATHSGAVRFDLYAAALHASGDSPLLGSGYLTFRYVLSAAAPLIPAYRGATTDFVHEDYLQAFLESGVPGAALLLAMALLPAWMAWRSGPRLRDGDRLAVAAIAAAMTTMAVHALFDFPFHIAVCLLLSGAGAALLSAFIQETAPAAGASRLREAGHTAVAALLIWVLVKPAVAEAAALYARSAWDEGRAQSAGSWFEMARRIEPRDWHYHAYAGEFWFVQAQGSGNPGAAQLADANFRDCAEANPREVSCLFWRISTHVYLRAQLAQPADAATLRAWAARAAQLAPLDPRLSFHEALVERL